MKAQKPRCPYCGSRKNHSKGMRKTVTMGKRPMRFCTNCNRKFTLKKK